VYFIGPSIELCLRWQSISGYDIGFGGGNQFLDMALELVVAVICLISIY
jgi:hypothetical protein